jgi:hypothetical protein
MFGNSKEWWDKVLKLKKVQSTGVTKAQREVVRAVKAKLNQRYKSQPIITRKDMLNHQRRTTLVRHKFL